MPSELDEVDAEIEAQFAKLREEIARLTFLPEEQFRRLLEMYVTSRVGALNRINSLLVSRDNWKQEATRAIEREQEARADATRWCAQVERQSQAINETTDKLIEVINHSRGPVIEPQRSLARWSPT